MLLCSKCGKNPVEKRKKKCTNCLRKNAGSVREYYNRNKKEIKARNLKREEEYIKKNRCRFCGIVLNNEIDRSDRCFSCVIGRTLCGY